MTAYDFFVMPTTQTEGMGAELATKFIETALDLDIDRIDLGVIAGSQVAGSQSGRLIPT